MCQSQELVAEDVQETVAADNQRRRGEQKSRLMLVD
jgi:hypothetical protein